MSNTINRYPTNTPAIVGLFLPCRPSHVALFVMPLVVNAVNRMFIARAVTNFTIKRFKVIKQTLNPTSAIIWIQFIIGIVASFAHTLINTVFATGAHFMATANATNGFVATTATRSAPSFSQAIGTHLPFRTTFATDETASVLRWSKCRPSPKFLINNRLCHTTTITE